MSSLESSTKQNSDDTNQASSQPKIITNEVLIDPVAQSMEQENDETKLANQVVEPMSRDNEKETETLEENAVKTKTTGVAKDVSAFGSVGPNFSLIMGQISLVDFFSEQGLNILV
uniref:Uncharacterized protein n=1 Tax=Daucus carota subsp. sativus TaxID=79200 RepID=A0A166CJZ8_DAUCS